MTSRKINQWRIAVRLLYCFMALESFGVGKVLRIVAHEHILPNSAGVPNPAITGVVAASSMHSCRPRARLQNRR